MWGGGWGERTYISVFITLPRGSNLERTDELVRFFEDQRRGDARGRAVLDAA